MSGVLTRVLIAVGAVLVLGWLGLMLRNERVGSVAAHRPFHEPDLPQAEVRRELAHLQDAAILDPDPKWELRRASYLIVHGQLRQAADAAERLARSEPANIDAWATLYQATRSWDPRRAALARREILRLNPLALQRGSARARAGAPAARAPASP
jgi:hypothetical protein